MYTGYPNRIRSDQRSSFTSEIWKKLLNRTGTEIRLSVVRAHSSLGIEERLHQLLKSIFKKVKLNFPSVNDNTLLHIALKAINDIIG